MSVLDTKKVNVGEMKELPGKPIAFLLTGGVVRPFIPQEQGGSATPPDFIIPLPEGCSRFVPLYPPALAQFRA